MKKGFGFIWFLLLILAVLSSCNRRAVTSMATKEPEGSYDAAAFNSVYVEAIKQKLMGNAGDALKYLEVCIKLNPESDAAYYQMAQIVVANGDIKNGKKYAAKAHSINNKNLWYLMMLAGMYYQEKNIDSAIIYYEEAVRYFPDNENLQLTLGNLYSENNKFDKATAIFNSFDNRYGVNEASTVSLIKSLMAEKKYDEALIKTELLINEFPDELLYSRLLAEIYSAKGDQLKAMEVYEKLILRKPDDAQLQLSFCDYLITGKSYNELLEILYTVILNSNVQREEKISLLARIIDLPDLEVKMQDRLMLILLVLEADYKDDDVIPLLRTELLIRQNKLTETATRLEEIIKERPGNYYAWEKLLLVYLQMKDFSKLTTRGEECATKFNMSFLAKILFATGATEMKKYAVALEELRKAEILAGDNKENMIQVLTLRADVYYRMKEYSKSFEIFEETLKLNSEDLTILNNYAYYLAEQNMKLKEAEEMIKKVIEVEKDNTTFLDTYAWVLYKRGKYKEAAKVMEVIVNSGEDSDAEWYEHYGYILMKQNKCSEARDKWNIALKLDGSKTQLIKEIENCGN
jgi:tetratricopeptide (TPR) repeat protein